MNGRSLVKHALAFIPDRPASTGTSLLIYHRIGGGTSDEMDTGTREFAAQLDVLAEHEVVTLDGAIARLEAGDDRPTVVLTFDDGFADVYTNAWPLLRERDLPFLIYVAGGLIGDNMVWEGSSAADQGAPALSWEQLAEMHDSGLCTVGNHTFSHARPGGIDAAELDRCSEMVAARLGHQPDHFAWPWGVEVPALRRAIADRFRSAATAALGRNHPGDDVLALKRIPVRRTDPPRFFNAKLGDRLAAERAYAQLVRIAKKRGTTER